MALSSKLRSRFQELEGKSHILRKRNEEYAEAMETIEKISTNYEQLEMDFHVMKEKYADADRNVARLSRGKEKLQKTISDLSRQVRYTFCAKHFSSTR
jgi:predicted  nucleic acid-binding Zn-ribbon protein